MKTMTPPLFKQKFSLNCNVEMSFLSQKQQQVYWLSNLALLKSRVIHFENRTVPPLQSPTRYRSCRIPCSKIPVCASNTGDNPGHCHEDINSEDCCRKEESGSPYEVFIVIFLTRTIWLSSDKLQCPGYIIQKIIQQCLTLNREISHHLIR